MLLSEMGPGFYEHWIENSLSINYLKFQTVYKALKLEALAHINCSTDSDFA